MSTFNMVYLDQNYLSNLVKARLGLIKDKEEAEFWLSLFNQIKAAVKTQKIACPASEFHIIEAMYSGSLEKSIKETIAELSLGLQLYSFQNILEAQIEDAAKQFLGKETQKLEPWTVSNLDFTLSAEVIEYNRRLKEEFAIKAKKLLDEYKKNPLGWKELVLQSKKSSLDGYLGKHARNSISQKLHSNSPNSQLSARVTYTRLSDLFNRLRNIGIDTGNSEMLNRFANSEELLNSPFVDIYGSIWAAIANYYIQGRKPSIGDFYDVPILASVLPYCGVVTTDSFMKEIIVSFLSFNDKYNTTIYSATKEDRYAFQKFIQEL